MLGEKMVTLSFGGAALGVSRARTPTWGHLALALTCPCVMSDPIATWHGAGLPLPWAWLSSSPHVGTLSAWAACPCAGSDPSTRWCWGCLPLPLTGARPAPPQGDTWPAHHVALGLACPVLGLRGRHDVAQRPNIIKKFSITTFNDDKHNNLCTPNNNIFYINSLNYNKNKYYYSQL